MYIYIFIFIFIYIYTASLSTIMETSIGRMMAKLICSTMSHAIFPCRRHQGARRSRIDSVYYISIYVSIPLWTRSPLRMQT